MQAHRALDGYENLSPDLKAALEEVERYDARTSRPLPPQMEAPPETFGHCWSVEFHDGGGAEDIALNILKGDPRFAGDLIGHTDDREPHAMRRTITIYAA